MIDHENYSEVAGGDFLVGGSSPAELDANMSFV